MARQTNKTVQSKYQPKTTNVTWIDTSGEQPVLKVFINGKWRATSNPNGGGSSNPGYTVTKSYQTYFPQQSIETVFDAIEGYALSNEAPIETPLVEGNTYRVTLEGVEYESVCFGEVRYQNIGAPWDEDKKTYDFSTYPFNFKTEQTKEGDKYTLITPEAGTYSLKIDEVIIEVTTTPEFEAAVKYVIESMS